MDSIAEPHFHLHISLPCYEHLAHILLIYFNLYRRYKGFDWLEIISHVAFLLSMHVGVFSPPYIINIPIRHITYMHSRIGCDESIIKHAIGVFPLHEFILVDPRICLVFLVNKLAPSFFCYRNRS